MGQEKCKLWLTMMHLQYMCIYTVKLRVLTRFVFEVHAGLFRLSLKGIFDAHLVQKEFCLFLNDIKEAGQPTVASLDDMKIRLYTANFYRNLRGSCRFFRQYLWKRERLCMLWENPVISADCRENPIIIEFPYNL